MSHPETERFREQQEELRQERESMKTQGHTPGPWDIDATKKFIGKIDIYTGKVIEVAEVLRNDDNYEANARLIATAPELLEAVKFLMSPHEWDKSHNKVDCKTDPCAYCFAEQVLAKAEGRS